MQVVNAFTNIRGKGRGNTFPPHPLCQNLNLFQRTENEDQQQLLVNILSLVQFLSKHWGPPHSTTLP